MSTLSPKFVNPHGQGSRTNLPQCIDASAAQYDTLDAAAVVTITGQAGRKIVVSQVIWSYSSAPTGGAVTIADGTTTLSWDVTAAGPGSVSFTPPLAFAVGATVTVTVADPGGAIVSKLVVNAYVQT